MISLIVLFLITVNQCSEIIYDRTENIIFSCFKEIRITSQNLPRLILLSSKINFQEPTL